LILSLTNLEPTVISPKSPKNQFFGPKNLFGFVNFNLKKLIFYKKRTFWGEKKIISSEY
jgi:hypothetical protein